MNEALKVLQDGRRTVIIIEGAEQERMDTLYQVLASHYGLPLIEAPTKGEATPSPTRAKLPGMVTVEGLTPAPPIEGMPSEQAISRMRDYSKSHTAERIPLPSGRYKGMTAASALARDREIALVTLFHEIKPLRGQPVFDGVVQSCKVFMRNMPNMFPAIYNTRDKQLACMNELAKIGGIDACINGWRNLDEFGRCATDEEVDVAFQTVLISFQDRGCRL